MNVFALRYIITKEIYGKRSGLLPRFYASVETARRIRSEQMRVRPNVPLEIVEFNLLEVKIRMNYKFQEKRMQEA